MSVVWGVHRRGVCSICPVCCVETAPKKLSNVNWHCSHEHHCPCSILYPSSGIADSQWSCLCVTGAPGCKSERCSAQIHCDKQHRHMKMDVSQRLRSRCTHLGAQRRTSGYLQETLKALAVVRGAIDVVVGSIFPACLVETGPNKMSNVNWHCSHVCHCPCTTLYPSGGLGDNPWSCS